MRPDRWENIKGQIKDSFPVEEHDTEHFEDEGGTDIEDIVFFVPSFLLRE